VIVEKTFGNGKLLSVIKRNSICQTHGDYEEVGMVNASTNSESWRGCSACRRKNEMELLERQKATLAFERQRAAEKLFNQSGVPSDYANATLENYDIGADTEGQPRAVAMCKKFIDGMLGQHKFKDTIILSGSTGTGKTHLSCAIANAVMHKKTVMFITHRKLLCMLQATWRNDSEMSAIALLKKLEKIDLLIIDEFGSTKMTDNSASAELLFEMFNDRYANGKPNILLTNLDLEGMYYALSERVNDRIKEAGFWCDMRWESYRSTKRKLKVVK
jgi:DNA replication protein DnaC